MVSLKNVKSKDHRLIACCIGAYLFVLSAMYFLNDGFLKVATVADPYWLGSKAVNKNIDDISWFQHRHEDMANKIKQLRGGEDENKEENGIEDVEMENVDEPRDFKKEDLDEDNDDDDENKANDILMEEEKDSQSIVPVESESDDDEKREDEKQDIDESLAADSNLKSVELIVNQDVPVPKGDAPSVQHYTVMIRSLPDRFKKP